MKKSDVEKLDEIIVGRVDPHIYAFLTSTVPSYLKVGDTYRPVSVRIAEWKKHFKINEKSDVRDWPAVIENDFFRDYSVHQFLQEKKNLKRLDPKTLEAIGKGKKIYFSNEFFKNGKFEYVEAAIKDIKKDRKNKRGTYLFYSVSEIGRGEDEELPERKELTLRPNQEEAVKRFVDATNAGRNNLLMYAVMRFGKTVTALKCAQKIDSKFIVVVSGKADVSREWRNTVLGFKDFEDYVFLSKKDLEAKYTRVTEELKAGHKVVLFATLQDLKGDKTKPKHEQIFSNHIDLLIIDETHFAARAKEYGKKLIIPKQYEKADEEEECDAQEIEKSTQFLDAKVRLHLSGTPYRILMGSEFAPEDIISFCQFTDIIKAQQEWNSEILGKEKIDKEGNVILDENGQPLLNEEWDNPYYGFPQMVRFAFNLNDSAMKKLKELEASGITSKFGELFKPKSIEKDSSRNKLHLKFVHEKEVLDLLRAIDGSEEEQGILPFLNYKKIEEGQMCHHIVCILPYCASCDALEALLKKHKKGFRKLNEYKVINISGIDVKRGFVKISDITKTIAEHEKKHEKTLTLTVNRMLTGSTVPEWDTMLFLKDTSSPQEYDQAIFRLQNKFTSAMEDKNGHQIEFNKKPQTLLVDFDPGRMFRLQEARAQCYNLNIDKNGNLELKKRVAQELEVSPIVLFNKDKIHRVEASDILSAVSEYSSKRGVAEEVEEIQLDEEVCKNDKLFALINSLPKLGSKEGLTIKPHNGDETHVDFDTKTGEKSENPGLPSEGLPQKDVQDIEALRKRLKTYHALILFYSFLVPDRVHSLDEIINVIDKNTNNKRIAKHLGLEKSHLKIYRKNVNWLTLQQLDYKIQNLDCLANEAGNIDVGSDYSNAPDNVKKAIIAMNKFGRLGESKIVTPLDVAYNMVKQIPGSELKKLIKKGEKILDPASKVGEFAIAIVSRCSEQDINLKPKDLRDSILSIPMCGVTYEFTRKVYELLGLNPKCIASPEKLTSYDLLKVKTGDNQAIDYNRIKRLLTQKKDFDKISINDKISIGGKNMSVKISVVISNPPYHELDGGAQVSAIPIYPFYVSIAKIIAGRYSSFIMPARWYAGGKGLDDFRDTMLNDKHILEFHDFPKPDDCFPGINIRSGLCYFLRDQKYDCTTKKTKFYSHIKTDKPFVSIRNLKATNEDILIRYDMGLAIINKIVSHFKDPSIDQHISAAKAFGLRTFFIYSPKFHREKDNVLNPLKCYGKGGLIGYVENEDITSHREWIRKWKVYIPESNNIGTELNDDNLNAMVGHPNTVCTETFLVVGADLNLSGKSCANLTNYLKTRFVRFLISLAKSSQHGTSKTFRFVPLQDFNETWTDEKLYAKYRISKQEQEFIKSMIKPME